MPERVNIVSEEYLKKHGAGRTVLTVGTNAAERKR
jgi:hypothetical protein